MYLATISFYGDDQKTRETIVIGEDEVVIHAKIESVKRILKKHNLRFVAHIIEEIHGVSADSPEALEFLPQSDKITH